MNEVVGEASRRRQLALLFGLLLAAAVLYIGHALFADLSVIAPLAPLSYLLLAVALLIALSFEFVNGFHDTANAVATVIYTNALPPRAAVVWSGVWNFIGVLISSGAVAFGIVSLLPVELILEVGSSAGFAMVFALLLAAVVWNLGTWLLGLPTSSSHTLIGSIIGVGLMNQAIEGASHTSGVDWSQAAEVGYALLLSPMIGFTAAALLFLGIRLTLKNPVLYRTPQGRQPPPLGTRTVLILTCTGVSFAHGSNDGQKGMGLIMLVLIGLFPSTYALSKTVPPQQVRTLVVASQEIAGMLGTHGTPAPSDLAQAREVVLEYVKTGLGEIATPPAIARVTQNIADAVAPYSSYENLSLEMKGLVRRDMHLVNEALARMKQSGEIQFTAVEQGILDAYRENLEKATMFIPVWVKIAVACALGLGTMVGWERITTTVGLKIGKQHLTYAQGACAESVAMCTIAAADLFGLPVSTTHVLSSGVVGTMAASRAGVQTRTVRNILIAWFLTLPMSVALAAGFYWLLRSLAHLAFAT